MTEPLSERLRKCGRVTVIDKGGDQILRDVLIAEVCELERRLAAVLAECDLRDQACAEMEQRAGRRE